MATGQGPQKYMPDNPWVSPGNGQIPRHAQPGQSRNLDERDKIVEGRPRGVTKTPCVDGPLAVEADLVWGRALRPGNHSNTKFPTRT